MKWIINFIDDCQNLTFEELDSKYSRKIPKFITVSKVIRVAQNENRLSGFIDNIWHGDNRDKKIYFLLRTFQGTFEVFVSERGSKHWLTIHNTLENAAFDKVDLILSSLGFSASDTKIR